ncbi:Fic family protein [Solirubrobacter phytolaccae]|uniref:Fic family protein n=1 Tax=Solirubrobacter phytolaccae TaxID=1404360 RepID=A0A9X3SFC1_9ACTN|nr:Fic family protein [Solirubrobacter phytolaccae]MDA0181292.1 Fic family protein [Solirubrobacter phytolaccae]
MATLVKLQWPTDTRSGLSRRERQGCEFEAYVPDRLAEAHLSLNGDTAADVSDAEAAIRHLNQETTALADSEAMARLLLRAEAVASSKIEGLEVGGRRLLRADLARDLDDARPDITATEVLNNVEAMHWAVETLSGTPALRVDDLLAVNERLLAGTDMQNYGGKLRDEQNWIGGSSFNPCSAAFVPPPPERVRELMEDLCSLCNQDRMPAVAQAALAHAQFETIHPFADGNGRTGRALIHVILRRRGLAPRFVPPISLVLATWSKDYIDGLTRTRFVGPPDDAAAIDGVNAWISLFAGACRRAVQDAGAYEERVRTLQAEWRKRLGRVRKDSAAELLIQALPGAPMVTVQSAAALTGRSFQAVNEAIPRLVDAGVLTQTTIGQRNRAFEAAELIDSFTALERQLASPGADTLTSPPARRVPARPAN